MLTWVALGGSRVGCILLLKAFLPLVLLIFNLILHLFFQLLDAYDVLEFIENLGLGAKIFGLLVDNQVAIQGVDGVEF